MRVRRPTYVPAEYRYVSKHAERRPLSRVLWRIALAVLCCAAVAVTAFALARIDRVHEQGVAGWPQVVTPSPYPQPPATTGRRPSW